MHTEFNSTRLFQKIITNTKLPKLSVNIFTISILFFAILIFGNKSKAKTTWQLSSILFEQGLPVYYGMSFFTVYIKVPKQFTWEAAFCPIFLANARNEVPLCRTDI